MRAGVEHCLGWFLDGMSASTPIAIETDGGNDSICFCDGGRRACVAAHSPLTTHSPTTISASGYLVLVLSSLVTHLSVR